MSQVGKIRSLIYGRQYGFISSGGHEYFFHKDDYDGDWDQLIEDHNKEGSHVQVEFEPTTTTKGFRASDVTRV